MRIMKCHYNTTKFVRFFFVYDSSTAAAAARGACLNTTNAAFEAEIMECMKNNGL
jgi:hypothetical protein